MVVTWLTAFLDSTAADAEAVERYWTGVTGWSLSARRGESLEFATLVPPEGEALLRVQVVGMPPPNGMHLDVHTDDVEQSAVEVSQLGGAASRNPLGYAVCRSPGGLVFCLVPHGAGRRPAPTTWPGGASLVDQVCLDVPPEVYDEEVEFWAAASGWPRRRAVSAEFERLLPPASQPLRVLVQRLDEPGGPVGMHLDLASENRAAEVARHVALGGRVVREKPRWTTLLDPSGRAYCVTDRDPASGALP